MAWAASGGKVRYSFPAWRIFVFGVEVTQDVVSCNSNFTDARTPGLAEFVLASPNDRYVTTVEDIYALYDSVTTAQLSAGILSDEEYAKAVQENITKAVVDPVKRRILQRKVRERVKNVVQPGVDEPMEDSAIATPQGAFAALKGEVARFPFQVGQCVFHTGDAVRVFWRDPFDARAWYFEATGAVADWKEDTDEKGRRSVTVLVEDATRPFRVARVALNPALYDIKVVADQRFDALIRTWHVDRFQNMTLPEALFTITFGGETGTSSNLPPPVPIDQTRYGVNDTTKYTVTDRSMRSVGFFNEKESGVYTWGPTGKQDAATNAKYTAVKSLEQWQSIVDHRVPTDVDELLKLCIDDPTARANARANFEAAESIDDIIKEIGEHPELYPVDFGRLLMLIPSSLGPAGNLNVFLKDFAGIADQTEFLTRLQIIYGITERLNFSFYATPRGDIVCEMPLYSFKPEDFGSYAGRYIYPIDDTITTGSHFQHDKVRTLMLTDRSVISERNDTGKQSQLWIKPGSASLRSLVPQFGIVSERAEPWAFRNSPESAKYYCELKLGQANANAWTQNVSTVLHAGVGPNRPCWFEARDFIATIRNVANAIAWGKSGSVSQKLSLNYRRGWSGQMTPSGRHVYEPYGGLMADPLNYAMIFREKSNEAEESTMPMSGAAAVSSADGALALSLADRRRKLKGKESFDPNGDEVKTMFRNAIAQYGGVPPEWADDPATYEILSKEARASGDNTGRVYVGQPNLKSYQARSWDPDRWGEVHDKLRAGVLDGAPVQADGKGSSATGLGQLLLSNVDKYYPNGRAGIGDAKSEAVGMLKYIQARYGSPAAALASYGVGHEGY